MATLLSTAFVVGNAWSADPPAGKTLPTDSAHRASEVIGMTVKNPAGKDLGTVNDFVIDLNSGHVRYFALSYGGWLGLGNKLFAVPHEKFQVRRFADSNKFYLVLDISEETLKNAPGFDQSAWPDFATDSQWRQKIDRYYKTEPTASKPGEVKK